MELDKKTLKSFLKVKNYNYYRYHFFLLFAFDIFQFFPPGSGFKRENKCGSMRIRIHGHVCSQK